MFRIVIAAHDTSLQLDLERLLAAEPGLTVVGRSAGVSATLELVRRTQPDVVLVDQLHDPAGGLDVIEAVRHADRDVLVVALLRDAGPEEVRDALTAGATAFLEAQDLADGRVSGGRRFLLPSQALSRHLDAPPADQLPSPRTVGQRPSRVGCGSAHERADDCRSHRWRVPARAHTWRSRDSG